MAGGAVTCCWCFLLEKAARSEQVSLKVESQSKITVIAHRDEIIELQRALQLKACE